MFQYIHDVNAYVEQATGYGADNVKVELDEATFTVTAYPVDTEGQVITGSNPLVNKTLSDLPSAVKYYEEIIHQLSQKDVIRNI